MNETQFETALIHYLSTGKVSVVNPTTTANEPNANYLKQKLWRYEPDIKTTDQLWENFKKILEQLNQDILYHPLTPTEFEQVKQQINQLHTPYEAGQFLYGLNGVSQIEVDLEDGRHVFLTVFDQRQIGAGNTVYQVVNQIQRPAKMAGKQNRRFDTTLLINGLPILHIEEKTDLRDVNEALNQMHQYIEEGQFSDIFSTVQILVAITPNNIRYMANTTPDRFNKDFAFSWQRRSDNSIVRDWREFADSMLSIPMAHQMATNYMILDGTPNKQMLKVMRPYQVYATQAVIENLKQTDFAMGNKKIGYIWHTTGSGKTITSFKTAWLASRLPNIDKVVFVVDRIALTNQTNEQYRAYDPDGENGGSVSDTKHTGDLRRKLASNSNNIIITSVQKLGRLVSRKDYQIPNKNIVFIVDEAHRSTGGDEFKKIQEIFKSSVWVGYTGTPMFDATTNGLRTEDIFGKLLHAYTIREAIADRNVLGFKVDFKTTIDIRDLLKNEHPDWSDEQIEQEMEKIRQEEFDENIDRTRGEIIEQTLHKNFYDNNYEHVKLVVADIFKNWRNRSNNGKYNALLTTKTVSGTSVPMAMLYFREFLRVNQERQQAGQNTLKVAITFSYSTDNSDEMLKNNNDLHEAINYYNQCFGTTFGLDSVKDYTQDVMARLNKSTYDKNYLDLVIVVDQLLTGFDAPELNTLYVDRILKNANLIQAYSRTNRVQDMQEKPFGQIINYRWPKQNERLMNEALAIYANKDSASIKARESDDAIKEGNEKDGIIAKPFKDVLQETQLLVQQLANLSKNIRNEPFMEVPKSEKKQEIMFGLLSEYSRHISKLKQYTSEEIDGSFEGFDYNNPDALIEALGMTIEQEKMLTITLANELKRILAEKTDSRITDIELRMAHLKEIKVDYDYLSELIAQLINQIHQNLQQEAEYTHSEIQKFADGLEDIAYAEKIKQATKAIMAKQYPDPNSTDWPYQLKTDELNQVINTAANYTTERQFLDFRNHWGITDIISTAEMQQLFANHRYEQQDLDDDKLLTHIITQGSEVYKTLATDRQVQELSKIKYRNQLRIAFYQLADELVRY
ncbi:type I restriction endonuclease subunit R [Gallibacterium salpingitidis]|uniref:Type I restriction enzyme endonuclease subunit n=1 Tax=Gallibacterium salpingitidis TaxID=505341 RepID=A0A1A7NPL1_9PAST|nr:HsdR family type I site-specific deoxyribonuclease [Gallibacterium salpingitidis]OBW90979.1 DEAD/DEAH box helicase [Gallibacterium salpingitidis]